MIFYSWYSVPCFDKNSELKFSVSIILILSRIGEMSINRPKLNFCKKITEVSIDYILTSESGVFLLIINYIYRYFY